MTEVNKIKANNTIYEIKDASAVDGLSFANGGLAVTKGDGTTESVAFPAFYSFSVNGDALIISEVNSND